MGKALLVIGFIIAILKGLLDGHIQNVETAALLLIAVIFLLAMQRRLMAKLLTTCVAIVLFIQYLELSSFTEILYIVQPILVLLIVLYGLYIMLSGVFRR